MVYLKYQNVMKLFILNVLLITLASSITYNIQSTSECLSYDPTRNVCSKWSQTGNI